MWVKDLGKKCIARAIVRAKGWTVRKMLKKTREDRRGRNGMTDGVESGFV